MRPSRASGGFTLLEVVIAMGILGISLMAIFDLNAGAIAMHTYTKKLTVASLLARSKMTDLEQELYDKGFQLDDDEDAGDFSDEGWPGFKWRSRVIAPKTNGMSPQQLLGAIFGLPMGEGGDDPLSALMGGGGGKDAAKGGGPTPAGGAAGGMAGMAGGMMEAQFTQMVDQITKAVREVHLTVTWKEGTQTESVDLVTHVVSLGPGSDRNGPTNAQAAANTAEIDPATGQPRGGPNGVIPGMPTPFGLPPGVPPPFGLPRGKGGGLRGGPGR